MRLFHFSDDGLIRRFEPRAVAVPSARPAEEEWLNGPLVWAIDDAHQPMYLFPRDCPRVLIWTLDITSAEDRERWFGRGDASFIAFIEWRWLEALVQARLYRYELPAGPFRSLDDAGMWVAEDEVEPIGVELLDDLPMRLRAAGVELRVMRDFSGLAGITRSSLHVSAIRMRNAEDWQAARLL